MTAADKLKGVIGLHGYDHDTNANLCSCASHEICNTNIVIETLKVAAEIVGQQRCDDANCPMLGCPKQHGHVSSCLYQAKQDILAEAEALKGEKERG